MTITAKYSGVCGCCGSAIEVGSKIEWIKGQRARHTKCPAKCPATKKSSAPSVKTAPFARGEKWEPCKRAAFDSLAAAEVGRVIRADKAGVLCSRVDRAAWKAANGGKAYPGDRVVGAIPVDGAAYVVVAVDGYYESTEDNEEMGDMTGPGWQVTLYLRRATAEEQAKSDQEVLGESIVKLGESIAAFVARASLVAARAIFEAAKTEGQGHVTLLAGPQAAVNQLAVAKSRRTA